MKRLILLLILIVFGFFVYNAAANSIVIWPLIFPLLGLVALYYVMTSLVTKGMIEKIRGKEEDAFFIRCSMIVKAGADLVGGALVVTKNEVVFYTRKSEKGGAVPSWSCFTPSLEGYTIKKVDDHHMGIALAVSGETDEIKFTSKAFKEREQELRKALGWPEEQ